MKTVKIFGIPFFAETGEKLLQMIKSNLEKNEKTWIATVNPEFVMETTRDKSFGELLKSRTTINVIDGIGLVWANEIQNKQFKLIEGLRAGIEILMGKHRENLISGVDLMDRLCRLGLKVYFLGGWNDRAKRTAEYFKKRYPELCVVGYTAENFDFDTKADILFVAYGMKKQELWIDGHYDKLKVGVVMGVGRSFDYYSGDLKRAPDWVRKMGLEWLYSLCKEPKRWKRQLVLPKFIWKTLLAK